MGLRCTIKADEFPLASTIASSVIQSLFGHLTDRSPAPWLMPVGLLMAGGGLTLACLAPNYWLTTLAAAFAGIGVAAFHPEAARLVNAAAGKQRAEKPPHFLCPIQSRICDAIALSYEAACEAA